MTLLDDKLRLRLTLREGVIAAVAVQPSQRTAATRLFMGKPAEQVVALLPMLFRLCGQAQGVVAALAVGAARGEANTGLAAARRTVLAEAVREGLWRILMDWPQLLGEAADPAALAEARDIGGGSRLEAFLEQRVFGEPLAVWRGRASLEDLTAWAATGDTVAARVLARLLAGEGAFGAGAVECLPAVAGPLLAKALAGADEAFALYPTWDGQPRETGAWARMGARECVAELWRQGHGVSARFAARLAELADMAQQWASDDLAEYWAGAYSLGNGAGLAWAETARGLLAHRVALAADGSVSDYRIVAPTEWNFHPQGALAQGLRGVAAVDAEAARHKAWLMVQALDPCVVCEIEIEHA